MDRERYAHVKQVFREALRWAPEDRAAAVDALAGDEAVRDEVRSLLAHHVDAPEELPGGAEEDLAGRRTLDELLRAERAGGAAAGWSIERVVRTLDPIAGELAGAADRGRVHGAVRAGHVLLDEEAAAGLGGWTRGARIAERIDAADAAAAAPEQLSPALGPVGPWTDVYALALLCVELMLGRPAIGGEGSPIAAALARARDEAAQPTPRAVGLAVPGAVEEVLARALAMRPMERYQDVRRFWAALREGVAASGSTPRPSPSSPSPSPSPSASRPPRPRRPWVALVAAALAVLAAAAIAIQRCA